METLHFETQPRRCFGNKGPGRSRTVGSMLVRLLCLQIKRVGPNKKGTPDKLFGVPCFLHQHWAQLSNGTSFLLSVPNVSHSLTKGSFPRWQTDGVPISEGVFFCRARPQPWLPQPHQAARKTLERKRLEAENRTREEMAKALHRACLS